MFAEASAQFPFEKFPAAPLQVRDASWTRYDKGNGTYHWTMTYPGFYAGSLPMTLQITTVPKTDTSLIRIYRGATQIQVIKEPRPLGSVFGILQDSTSYGDLNGDSLPDVKFRAWCGGNGILMYLFRVIYLVQRNDGTFSKVSFETMDHLVTHPERDLDGDGNFEIITTALSSYEGHSYWLFNLYRFDHGRLRCVNDEFDYPVMVQFLYRENYEITDKISRQKMKRFAQDLPENFSASPY